MAKMMKYAISVGLYSGNCQNLLLSRAAIEREHHG